MSQAQVEFTDEEDIGVDISEGTMYVHVWTVLNIIDKTVHDMLYTFMQVKYLQKDGK